MGEWKPNHFQSKLYFLMINHLLIVKNAWIFFNLIYKWDVGNTSYTSNTFSLLNLEPTSVLCIPMQGSKNSGS